MTAEELRKQIIQDKIDNRKKRLGHIIAQMRAHDGSITYLDGYDDKINDIEFNWAKDLQKELRELGYKVEFNITRGGLATFFCARYEEVTVSCGDSK